MFRLTSARRPEDTGQVWSSSEATLETAFSALTPHWRQALWMTLDGFSALQSVSLVLVVIFLSYLVAILRPFLRRKPTVPGDPDRYSWHAFIPCRDESPVIATTLRLLRRNFP